jgi:hypothetical protein
VVDTLRLVGIVAVREVGLATVVGRSTTPPLMVSVQRTTAPLTKLVPVTVRVQGDP